MSWKLESFLNEICALISELRSKAPLAIPELTVQLENYY